MGLTHNYPKPVRDMMACVLSGRVGPRRIVGRVTRAFRHASTGGFKPSVSARSTSAATGRSLLSSLAWGRYPIGTVATSRGYSTDSEAGRIYRSLELSPDGKKLCVSWADGEESTYHALWLRHNCRCPQCWNGKYCSPLVYFDSLRNAEIRNTDVSGDVLNVRWGYSDRSEEHTGYIPLHYLRKHSYSANALQRRQDAEKPVVANHLPTVAYPDMMSDEKHLWMWLKNLNLYGMCLVTDMPPVEDEVLKLTGRFGGSHTTQYGETFKVVMMDVPNNIAYSEIPLTYHMDLSGWVESPPGVQILHCIIFDDCIEGGETLVLDVLPVLEELREKHPQQFETLTSLSTSYQVPYIFQDLGEVSFERQKTHIILDKKGEITAFNLQPHCEAPLFISEDLVETYYDAYCLLQEMLYDSKYQHKVRLLPGQALTINNRRCVHGRTAIKPKGGKRYLQGTYIGSDELKGATRLLAEKFEPEFVLKRTFNSDPL